MSTPSSTCPTPDELALWALGQLSAERFALIDKHLDSCPECQGRAAGLDGVADSLDARLRGLTQGLPSSDPGLNAWLAKARPALGRPDSEHTVDFEPHQAAPAADAAAAGDSGPPLPTGGSVLEALSAAMPGGVPRVNLRQPDDDPPTPVNRPTSEQMPPPQDLPEHYQLVGEIARGGMGAIFKGRDTDLGRDVAVKMMLATHKGRTEMLQRFVEEAQIGGQLQHPGIVPVYELGQSRAQRPYFTMKLVKGRTLSALLKERPEPAQGLSRWLGIFEQVCQTMAYAHARGVIHRDLKPANIMVGAFGEVQVMDWGLAKVLAKGSAAGDQLPPEEATVIRTPRSEPSKAAGADATRPSGSHTQTGSVLGTPAYMAPEQARGDVAQLDERCDVFGLGAILCQILTGQPPYTGKHSSDIHQQARRGDLADAWQRLQRCGADGELVTLARRCLEPEREQRPRHAGEVAQAVTSYLELVQERLRQAEVQRAAAQAKAEQEQKRREVEQAKVQVERGRRRAQLAFGISLLLLVAGASAAGLWFVNDQAEREAADLRHKMTLAQEQAARTSRHELLERDVGTALDQAQQLRNQLQAQLARPGGIRTLLNKPADWKQQIDLTRAAWQRARDRTGDAESPIAEALLAKIPALEKLLDRDDADFQLARELEKIREDRSVVVDNKLDYAGAARKYPKALAKAELLLLPGQELQDAARIQQSSIKEQLLAALDDWAFVAFSVGKKDLCKQLLQIARAADADPWKDQVRDHAHWQNPKVLQELAGQALADKQLLKRLSPQTLSLLGWLLGGTKDAEGWLREAVKLYPGDFWLEFKLGNTLHKANPQQAEGFFRAALAIRPNSTAAWNNLGNALADQKQNAEAITHYQRALQIDPNFANAHNGWGTALADQKQYAAAITHYQLVLQINPNFAMAHNNRGNALREQKQYAAAITHFQLALKIDPNFAYAHNNWGCALHDQKQYTEAIRHFQLALKIDRNLAQAHNNWGNALSAQKQYAEAITHFQLALKIDPNDADAHINWGNVLRRLRQYTAAITHYQQAIQINPNIAEAHGALGLAFLSEGRFAAAKDATAHALKLLPAADPRRNLAQQQLSQCEQLLALDQRLSAVLQHDVKPKNCNEQLLLARLCQNFKKHYATAARFYADAFAATPGLATDLQKSYRYNAACAAALAAAGQGKGLLSAMLDKQEKAKLRQQALGWLQADLALWQERAQSDQLAAVLSVIDALSHWQTDIALASAREDKALAQLPTETQKDWHKLWSDVAAVRKQAQACFTDIETKQGTLTGKDRQQTHTVQLKAGVPYVIDMHSQQFDTLLQLQDAQGQQLAENDDIEPGKDQNSRIVYVPKQDGDYRLIATSFQQQGTGTYTLTLRLFTGTKK